MPLYPVSPLLRAGAGSPPRRRSRSNTRRGRCGSWCRSRPGGSTDTLARTMGVKLADALGQQVVVDNRPGGNGDIGMVIVARAPADGHTIVLGYIANLAIAPSLYGEDAVRPGEGLSRRSRRSRPRPTS